MSFSSLSIIIFVILQRKQILCRSVRGYFLGGISFLIFKHCSRGLIPVVAKGSELMAYATICSITAKVSGISIKNHHQTVVQSFLLTIYSPRNYRYLELLSTYVNPSCSQTVFNKDDEKCVPLSDWICFWNVKHTHPSLNWGFGCCQCHLIFCWNILRKISHAISPHLNHI